MFESRNRNQVFASILRLATLTKKNLMRFYKNPKAMAFLMAIPIAFYVLIGLIFGNVGSLDTVYSVGWIDDDSTDSVDSWNPYTNISNLYNLFDEVSSINLIQYSSKEEARQAALQGNIDAFIYFPEGFEGSLDSRSFMQVGVLDNDTTSSVNLSLDEFYEYMNQKSQLSSVIRFHNITNTNLVTISNEINITSFQNSILDSILVINDGYDQGLDENRDVNMTLFYRGGSSISKINTTIGTIRGFYYEFYYPNSTSILSIFSDEILGTSQLGAIQYEIYFLQSVSISTKATIESIIGSVIYNAINYNPNEIDITLVVESAIGQEINQITFQSAGLLLYGPMTILSFALIVLTSEKKDGIYKRLSSSEVKNYEIILSSIIANIILIFMQFLIGVLIISLFGWNPIIASPIDAILGITITIFLFSFFILALSFTLTPVFKDPDTAGGGVWIILIPLMMLSGIFFPLEIMGEGIQAIASVLPTRYAVLIMQDLLLKGLPLLSPSILVNMLILTMYSLVLFVIGIFAFRKFKK